MPAFRRNLYCSAAFVLFSLLGACSPFPPESEAAKEYFYSHQAAFEAILESMRSDGIENMLHPSNKVVTFSEYDALSDAQKSNYSRLFSDIDPRVGLVFLSDGVGHIELDLPISRRGATFVLRYVSPLSGSDYPQCSDLSRQGTEGWCDIQLSDNWALRYQWFTIELEEE